MFAHPMNETIRAQLEADIKAFFEKGGVVKELPGCKTRIDEDIKNPYYDPLVIKVDDEEEGENDH